MKGPVHVNVVGKVLAVCFDGPYIPFDLLNDEELARLKDAFADDGRGVASEGSPAWTGRAYREMYKAIKARRAALERLERLTEEERVEERVQALRAWYGDKATIALP